MAPDVSRRAQPQDEAGQTGRRALAPPLGRCLGARLPQAPFLGVAQTHDRLGGHLAISPEGVHLVDGCAKVGYLCWPVDGFVSQLLQESFHAAAVIPPETTCELVAVGPVSQSGGDQSPGPV